MRRILKNPWTWILIPLPVLYVLVQLFGLPPDTVQLVVRLAVFFALSILASKYVLRSFGIVYDGNTSNEGMYLVGWGIAFVSLMATQVLGWVTISLDRPEWLTLTYWGPDIVISFFYGLSLVVWSTRRATPRPQSSRIGLSGFLVGFLSALGLMVSGVLPSLAKLLATVFGSLTHAL